MDPINPIEQTYRTLTASGKKITKLFSGNPNEEGICFPPGILKKVYDRYFDSQIYQPHPKGLLCAREAIQNYYQSHGADVDTENIVITSGTSESFFYLFSLLTQPGDNILTPNPAYPLFDHIAELAKIELRHYFLEEEKDWEVDLDSICNQADSQTKAIVLVSPNNPTGSVISAEQIQEIALWANQKNIALICDEVFSEFCFGSGSFPRAISVSSPNLCFTLNGISKMFALPALKLSWIAVTGEKQKVESVVDRLETIADTFLSCHIPIQKALPFLFSEGKEFLKSYRAEVAFRRNLVVEQIKKYPQIEFSISQGSFYLFAKINKNLGLSEEEFVIQLMKQKNIFVHPGYFYDYEKGIHCVISFLTEKEKMQQGLEALARFLNLT